MECNKEEAISAMEIAKKRLLCGDYAGAKEMGLKAKKLFPLDNISKFLVVCEVHCSAQLMSNGLYDWYKIIQVGPFSDEIIIRKQYRELVRLLHPDKNKFPGAEVAFKLVVEANNTLSNQAKRKIYDKKRKQIIRSAGLQKCTRTNSAHNSSTNSNRDKKKGPQQKPQLQPEQSLNFWTACPFCWTQHHYKRSMLYKNVHCMKCSRVFMANALPHLNSGHVSAAMNLPQQCTGQQQQKRSGLCTGVLRARIPDSNPSPPSRSNASSANNIREKRRVETVCMDKIQTPNPCSELNVSLAVNQKRCDGEETDTGAHSAATSTPVKRLPHNNYDVKYNGTKAGFSNPAKKARVEVKGERDSNGDANTTDTNVDGSTSVEKEVKEEGREKERRGEIDGAEEGYLTEIMGQKRGEIVGVHASQTPSSCSKLNLSLNATQRRDDREGNDAGLHSSGTRTHLQKSSHNKPGGKDNCTKAGLSSLAKKPTIEMKEEQDGNGDANTTNTDTNACTSVEEVKEQGREKEQVKPSGLPQERDTAFKPSGSAEDKGASSQAVNFGTLTVRCELSQPDADVEYEYPDAEFHDFAMSRTCNNFQEGDIWALYSDLDTFPKYYGSVFKVEHNPLNVHINWLKACPNSEVERAWMDADLPISCGKFRVTTQNTTYDNPDYFSHMVSVRHHDRGNYFEILPEVGEVWAIYGNWSAGWMLHDFKTCKFDIVEIIGHREDSIILWPLRQVPEFRSVFMQEDDDGTGSGSWKVPANAYTLFSHKIPAIRLIEECGGKPKEFWELDPASVPCAFLYHDN
ncbi:DNAJ heat shock N-terminal domain-containing protein [Rhynchospora pubera]|uniref:DNAJ heat shock N-terminal domain-containing protein n=1 Tax=Rhynchospora pubera TaxID=906938 RepID=A0AAV8G9G7_9POAL|nr:DNAJ heat shock N-terminal domain-containing protein [Rhynchospora pubera]